VAGVIFSVGHSNLSADAFFEILAPHHVQVLADVRAFPGSRRHPHFGREALVPACRVHGITYRWMPELGGRRRAGDAASPHVGWEVDAFRHYADYMDTSAFDGALPVLEAEAGRVATVFMCAEALWWQCHRRLIADRLLAGGWEVRHIGAGGRLGAHRLPDFARIVGGRIVYDRLVDQPLRFPSR